MKQYVTLNFFYLKLTNVFFIHAKYNYIKFKSHEYLKQFFLFLRTWGVSSDGSSSYKSNCSLVVTWIWIINENCRESFARWTSMKLKISRAIFHASFEIPLIALAVSCVNGTNGKLETTGLLQNTSFPRLRT